MKNVTIIIFITIIVIILPPAQAADSTQSATPSSSIRVKLEELKKEIASKAAKFKVEIEKKLRDKAYAGILKNKSETTLTLATSFGPRIVNINQDTLFQSKLKGRKFSKDTLEKEDFIVCLGDRDETAVLNAKKVILLPPPKLPQKTYLWGQIISSADSLITLKDKDYKNIAVSPPKGVKFKINDFVILTGNFNENEVFEAQFLYVIPQGVNLKTKKETTASGKPSPSPSPKTTR